MPVKLGSKIPAESEPRIEIIPLIDIMFFLLAAFMLVSLSMVNQKSIMVSLPTSTVADLETKKDFISISVDRSGAAYLEKQVVGANELVQRLSASRKANPEARVFINGDADARHGDIIRVLDLIRSSGIQKVAFEIRSPDTSATKAQ